MKSIILASTSPRRKELMGKLGLEFMAVSSNYEENMGLALKPMELAKTLSAGKAEAIVLDYPDHIIIAADTFVALGDELLGKPRDEAEAVKMLKKISGQAVSVITGYTIIETPENKKVSHASEAKVHIKDLSDLEITNYIKTGEPLDKAGAFAIQGIGAVLIRRIEGDYHGIMGLPLFDLAESLKDFGVHILS